MYNQIKSGQIMELSISDVHEFSLKLAEKIKDAPDLVVFVAKGSYQIGECIAEYFHVPIMESIAKRSGNQLKELVNPILQILPKSLKVWLRKSEMSSNFHEQYENRTVSLSDPNGLTAHTYHRILLVDDSVDTGHTVLAVRKELMRVFPKSEIQIASFYVFSGSLERIKVDYHLFDDVIFSGPWSNDSKEHRTFLHEYEQRKEKHIF